MSNSFIDYPEIVDKAMRGAVRDVLTQVGRQGLPNEHHFFISFRTTHPGVSMSDALRSRHPESITIVLQYQFWDLKVEQDRFSVMLSFNNVPEKLVVPFSALTAFADPSVKFGLQFHTLMEEGEEDDDEEFISDQDLDRPSTPSGGAKTPAPKGRAKAKTDDAKKDDDKGKVITLDAFRKK